MAKTNKLQQPRRLEFPTRSAVGAAERMKKTSFYSKSWKEKAICGVSESFLGGYVWPPRSYSCSFCAREFSSAQALGGHMNIHRRDRARLKHEEEEDHQDRFLTDSLADQKCVPLRLKRCFEEEEEEKRWSTSKRRKDLFCCFVKSFDLSGGFELQEFESEVTDLCPIHVGELDLELRLGRSSA